MSSESAAVLIAAGAFGVSALSLVFTALERRRRITEVDLLRRQVEGAEQERDTRRTADVMAAHGGVSGGSPEDQHEIFIFNGGPAIARAIDVWVKSPTGEDITPPIRVAPGLGAIERERVLVEVPQAASRAGGLWLWGRWRDDSGDREGPLLSLKKP